MMTSIRTRILAFLDLAHCQYKVAGNTITTSTAVLAFTADHLSILREGKPERLMPYEKLNMDKILFLLTAQSDKNPAH
ncbi:MAG: hypothetical protein KJ556_00565 [Gammaproteobacteria bacterium]|nr:hypothetical protein [Gammaproteobacteria bacterium]MBU2058643.1 hypothetical protein [Gammaproteobacteria bacterium]MBU2173595.1 hypothetical protein [Gammaproteobacteria bacterium]MBU2246549.1 hypothetical protein [Gammaproteobacteria bacterium]MBU2343222.1 hypothetical protein [Gammaproteobacteria bacterium]